MHLGWFPRGILRDSPNQDLVYWLDSDCDVRAKMTDNSRDEEY